MKAIIHYRRPLINVLAAIVLTVVVAVGGTVAVQALNQGGGTSHSGGCNNRYYLCTDNGFGWTLYRTNGSSGTPTFFKHDSWGTVSSQCAYAGGVYIFEVAGKSKPGGGIYTEAYPMNIIWEGGTGPGSSYWNRHYSGDDFGTVYSRYINNLGGSPNRWDGSGHDLEWFCYNLNPPPPTDYVLVPTIAANQTTAQGDSPVNVTPSVANTGHASSTNTTWQISTFELAPGSAIPAAANNAISPCTYYDPRPPSGTSCTIEAGNTGVGSFAVGSASTYSGSSGSAFGVKSLTLGDYPPGTKVCYALSVKARANVDAGWAQSAPVCVIIGKKPFIQILGSDLISSGNVQTSTTTKSNQTFGSWVEYGIFAVKNIIGAGSGSAYSGQGLANANVCSESLLSFTNAANSTGCKPAGVIGNYNNAASLPDIAASFPVVTSGVNLTPTFDPSYLADQTKAGLFTATGNLTLGAATIGSASGSGQPGVGRWVVINAPNANVTITGNITYNNGPFTSIYDIPQLIIIAKNITIADSVTQVDAWLIAQGATMASDGVLSTCTFNSADPSYLSFPAFPPFPDVTTQGGKKLGLTINTCNQPLTINGPVMAQKLDLLRTAGSNPGAASGDPAEVINLRPDAYLWAQAHSIQSGRLQTANTTELPPRL